MSSLLLCLFTTSLAAQKPESIYVNLYTDSLKKGAYNYINIDGKLPGGKYVPLDTASLIFSASDGKFYGNCLWLNPEFSKEKVSIKVVVKANPALHKEFTMYIRKKPDNEKLKTVEELMKDWEQPRAASHKKHSAG
jgi:hypothetical protein